VTKPWLTTENIRGKRVRIVQPVNIYGCALGDDVFVGPFVEIQRNSRIGDNSRISSHSFICEYVTIGDNCFIGHGVMFTNDKFTSKLSIPSSDLLPTVVGNNVRIGSNATLLPGITIGDNAIIGAGSVVTKDVRADAVVYGNPAKERV
jgi:acetyltransferase-like isoleucine patch superfamily enzyme